MTSIRTSLLTAVTAVTVSLCSTAQVRWLSTEHDFGAFAEELGPVTTEFLMINESQRPVTILHAQASCGCTRPSYPNTPVQPGDTARLSVTYNPMGRPGRFDKNVKVKTDASPQTDKLTIKGVVIGSPKTLTTNYPVKCGVFNLKNTVVNYGDITAGHVKNKFVEGYNLSSDSIRPRIAGLPPYIDANIAPEVVGPGVQFIISLFFNASRATDVYGLTENTVAVTADNDDEPCRLTLIATVNEDFSRLTPQQRTDAPRIAMSSSVIDMNKILRGEKPKANVSIENFGKDPLMIRKIQISADDKVLSIRPSKTKIKKGAKADLDIIIDTTQLPEGENLINSRAVIITNDPEHPISTLRVVGEVK